MLRRLDVNDAPGFGRGRAALFTAILGGAVLAAPFAASAGSQPTEPYPTILLCEQGHGCKHSPLSGTEPFETLAFLIGDPDVDGARAVICESSGCSWAVVDDESIDLVYGGDGTPDGQRGMVFTEDEVASEGTLTPMDFTEEPEGMEFTEDEVTVEGVTPMSGNWIVEHGEGIMDCGVMNMAIPAGDTEVIEMSVSGDTVNVTGISEAGAMDMTRQGGWYHAEIQISQDGISMTLNFDTVYPDPGIGQGMIWTEYSNSGVSCRIDRPYLMIHEDVDFFPAGA